MGGGQLGLARYLSVHSRHERALLVFNDGPLAEIARERSIPVSVIGGGDSWRSHLARVAPLRTAVADLRPQLVLANSLTSANVLGLARVPRTPFVAYLREDLSRANISGAKRPAMMFGTLQRFDGFFANSRYTASTIPWNLRHKIAQVVYPISGVMACAPRSASPERSAIRVLSLSRLDAWKGLDVLVEAARRVAASGLGDRFEFIIAGGSVHADPAYGRRLREVAASSGARISFTGHVDDVDSLIRECHVLALCSTRPEPFGQVVVQAMSHGLLVISSRGGGPEELLAPTNSGILVRPNDPSSLADAFIRCVHEDALIDEYGARAASAAASFADDRTIMALEVAIEKMVRALAPT
ncbi:glycosyltransferase family 4 protein [Microbacterium sp. E-13]|uniref:glycosyltransferase family 4 protein n=1 Tax=Microbacterium sp. E-13 TaxID=3404048 RepID=UPI003CF8A1D2